MFTNTRPFTVARSMRRSTAVAERVQRPDHVVAIEAQIEGEVVAGAGRNADVRHPCPGRDRGDQRLRAVTARHADHVGAAATASSASCSRSSPGSSRIGSIPALPALDDQVEPLDLPAAGPRVHDQHRVLRRPGPGQPGRVRPQGLVGAPQRVPRGQHRPGGQGGDQDHQEPADPRKNRPVMVPPSAAATTSSEIIRTSPRRDTAYSSPSRRSAAR